MILEVEGFNKENILDYKYKPLVISNPIWIHLSKWNKIMKEGIQCLPFQMFRYFSMEVLFLRVGRYFVFQVLPINRWRPILISHLLSFSMDSLLEKKIMRKEILYSDTCSLIIFAPMEWKNQKNKKSSHQKGIKISSTKIIFNYLHCSLLEI